MSYILEALKKSELERQQLREAIDLDIDSSAESNFASDTLLKAPSESVLSPLGALNLKASLFTRLILLLTLILLSVLGYWLIKLPQVEPVQDQVVSQTISDVAVLTREDLIGDSEQVSVAIVDDMLGQAEVEGPVVTPASASVLADKPQSLKAVEIVHTEVVGIEQANAALSNLVPSLSITSHIYSSQAKRRSIVVNGERLAEGDFVANQVQVKEITHQGMILAVKGSLLAVSRSRGWNR